MPRITAYIAGPMTGIEDFNYPLFNRVAEEIRGYGYEVYNPAYRTDTSRPWTEYMRENIRELPLCDLMVLLPGWEKSRGAILEITVSIALEIPMVFWPIGMCQKTGSDKA